MRSGLVIHSGLALAILMIPMTAAGQTSYAAEAAKYPDAASKPTPKMADGHPDLNGVWHHYFGIGTVQKVGDSFVVGLGRPAATKSAGPPRPVRSRTPNLNTKPIMWPRQSRSMKIK